MNEKIKLSKIWNVLLKNAVWIVLITVAGGIVAAGVNMAIRPVYQAEAGFFSTNISTSAESPVSSSLVTAQQMVVEDYIEITKSDRMLEKVSEDMRGKYGYELSVKTLSGMISASQKNNTSVFKVTVQGTNPEMTLNIVNSIADQMQQVIDETVHRTNTVEVLSRATEVYQISPHKVRNIAIGALIGLILSCEAFILTTLFDRTLRSSKDIKDQFDLPILGEIPIWGQKTDDN